MTEPIDINKLAGEFVKSNLDNLLALAASGLKDGRDSIRLRLRSTYERYLDRLADQYSKGKSFFSRTEPIPLYDFFVPLDLSTQRRTLSRASISDVATVSPRSIVTGTGGSGKTMLMRHFLIGAIEHAAKTPIFVELRQMNRSG